MLHLRHRHDDEVDERRETADVDQQAAHDRFGGVNLGAAFYGWLVATALAVLLTSLIGSLAAALNSTAEITQNEAERQAGTIGIVAGAVLVVVLTVGYYAGGYVAGRMSRFDGARQGVAAWAIGLLATLIAVGLGAGFGHEYNLLDRVDLPRIPVSGEELGYGAAITAIAVVVLTLLAAVVGGKAGRHYHARVDREMLP